MQMIGRIPRLAAFVVAIMIAASVQAQAGIKCSGEYQVIRGQGQIATPYCEDQYLARVARGYGIRVSASAIRQSPSRKEEVCRVIGHDGRVASICHNYRSDDCSRFKC